MEEAVKDETVMCIYVKLLMLMLLDNYAKCANDNGRSKYSKERFHE